MKAPHNWRIQKMSDLGEVRGGRQVSPHKVKGELRPYLRVANVFDGFISTGDVKRMKFTGSELETYRLETGDLLLTEGQSLELVGRPALYKSEIENCCFQNTLVRLRTSSENSEQFVFYLCQYLFYTGAFQAIAKKTTSIAHLGLSRFANLEALVPPFPEQQKIAEILGACDEAIEAQERLIAQKEKRKKGFMQKLLTGQVRFPEFVRSKAYSKSRFFAYPDDWSLLHVEEFANQVIRRNTFGDLPVLSCTKHRGLVDSLSYFKKQVFAQDTSGYKVVCRDEFAYATNHLEEGSIGYQNIHDKAIISPIYCVFKTNEDIVDSWLYPLFKTELFRHIFEANTNASVNRRGSVKWNVFKKIQVAVPALEEQRKISDVLSFLVEDIDLEKKKLDQLKLQKKSLMQQLLTGKVRVAV